MTRQGVTASSSQVYGCNRQAACMTYVRSKTLDLMTEVSDLLQVFVLTLVAGSNHSSLSLGSYFVSESISEQQVNWIAFVCGVRASLAE